jgi:elongation factor Ts
MSITASMVKELRERTGAGMMECKKALQETKGDMEEAITSMRKRGQAKAAKRAGKIAAEGVVVIQSSGDNKQASMIEVNCETDFVARDTNFKVFTSTLAKRCIETNAEDAQALLQTATVDGKDQTLEQMRQELIVKIGENVQLRRVASLASDGIVGVYNHGDRIGVIVSLDQASPELAKDVAMHIAATNPQAVDANSVPTELIEKEREIFSAQAKESGKPDNIIEKMVTGRIAKFLKEVCLIDQPFVKNPDQTVGDLLKAGKASVIEFVRFEVGEGIEKKTQDFAEEVKAQVQGSK